MPSEEPTTDAAEVRTPSALRLRLGVFMILVWFAPIWALGPWITHALSGLPTPPTVTVVTTTILVIQTITGLLGFWIGGTQVKTIVKDAPRRRDALRAIWSIFLHGEIPTEKAESPPT